MGKMPKISRFFPGRIVLRKSKLPFKQKGKDLNLQGVHLEFCHAII
jgi:hypothetical protein